MASSAPAVIAAVSGIGSAMLPIAPVMLPFAPTIFPVASLIAIPSLAVGWWTQKSKRGKAEKEVNETKEKAPTADAAEALRRAEEERLATERRWLEGVRPECRPSEEDIVRMKAEYLYNPNFLHLAVVGSSGAGKSSFINAVRGLSNNDPTGARTGIVEMTNEVTRYPDPRPNSRIVWYDVPGAGTLNVPDWQYFNDLGLYIFDCIIVLVDNRVLDSDLAILHACEQFRNVEAFIVRSKSDQHINNMAHDKMGPGFDLADTDDETRAQFQQMKSEERTRFIKETRENVQMNLDKKNLSPKKVHIVCKDALLATLRNARSSKAIDEAELLSDVGECVLRRLQSGC
ncbi:interferon-inducible GTPase-domain-containing protein [Suillus paluster]|uniref:interferon-inducible GTPase-domain-containing protein n=1 Tax=Suillus paluster TaxID=48578 RepID=UPI001B87AEE9|nr:interferon-inducible GTPase-domain-containing protein [Suillus paluster]KAG1728285.1 interferon-inducible GTPase-domain-containing protein [Suillus paluster]